jgi:SAM-dependent methyltransferase
MLRSLYYGWWDYAANAVRAEMVLMRLTLLDLLKTEPVVRCNICGWSGREFYPNTGPGYDERNTLCPGCSGLDRHRSLLAILLAKTDFFGNGRRIIEVAPMRGFDRLCHAQPGVRYTSFDLTRYATEVGDITDMHYRDGEADFFVCFHVLEHIPDAHIALQEIYRVLRPGGLAVFQVPINWESNVTVEYEAPDLRDAGHVRTYGRDFASILTQAGFQVRAVTASQVVDSDTINLFGLSDEPVFFAVRPARHGAQKTGGG